MSEIIALPDYHRSAVKPRSFQAIADAFCEPGDALWEFIRRDVKSGRELSRLIAPNTILDNGALQMLKNTWNLGTFPQITALSKIVLTDRAAPTTLTTALTNGQAGVTSLAVAALPGNGIASGVTITIGFGTAQTQNVVTSGAAAGGATSISVTSFTANAAYAIGTAVVPVPAAADLTPSPAGTQIDSGVNGPTYTFSGTGAGNRQVQIQYTFGTGSTAGTYTEAWTTSHTAPLTTAQQATEGSHLIFPGQVINSSTSLQATIIEKV